MGRKNILLMSMSTLNPKQLQEHYYEGNYGEEGYFRGVSQQEAGTKFYFRKLLENGEKFDKIFLIESPEASGESVDTKQLSRFVEKPTHFMTKADASAVEFYKERILQYIQGREHTHLPVSHKMEKQKKILGVFPRRDKRVPVSEVPRELPSQVRKYEESAETLLYIYPDVNDLFEDIHVVENIDGGAQEEQKALFECINELCDKIQSFSEDGSKVRLYLYMQGARRYETFIINAAVNMLGMRKIKVESSIAINFYSNNNSNGDFDRIVDTTFNDRIFEMVSGMNEFINTGRGDTLFDFYENSKKIVNLEQEKEIILAIRRISTSLSLCDVKKFDKEINGFNHVLEKYLKAESTNLLFRTFVEDLRKDYEKDNLLDEDNSPTVNLVNWSLRKHLYQLALTLIEARIPNDIVSNKIIFYGDDKALLSVLNKLIDINQLNKFEKLKGTINPDQANYIWIHCALKYKEADNRENLDHQVEAYTWELDNHYLKTQIIDNVTRKRGIKDEQRRENLKIGVLLKKYRELCDTRNAINHANNNKSVEVVEKQVKDFISYYNDLIEQEVRVDLSKQFSVKNDSGKEGSIRSDSLKQKISLNGIDTSSLPKS